MKIADARVIVTSPGRNFVTLKIVTSSGLTGVGDATLNGREKAVASYLSSHVIPTLIGRDPATIEDTWQYLYKGAYWRRGPVTMAAIAAVDTALWDIKGKVAGLPVYQLLGGRSRTGVTVYGHATGTTIDEVLADISGFVAQGYRAVRVQAAIPGLDTIYGVHRPGVPGTPPRRPAAPVNPAPGAAPALAGDGPSGPPAPSPGPTGAIPPGPTAAIPPGPTAAIPPGPTAAIPPGPTAAIPPGPATSPALTSGAPSPVYEPASSPLPVTEIWDTSLYLGYIPTVFARVREEFGPSLRLLHDAHHRLSPIEAARLGKSLEPYALTWLEDPVPAELPEAYRLIRQHTTTPLAVGEVFNSIWDAQQLIQEHLIDYVRATVVHAGGITHLRRIFDLAALHQVRTGSHGATDLSPICMAAALHLDIAVPNFGLQEFMPHSPETDAVFPHGYRFEDGYLHPPETPGLGVDIDEELAARYPYRPASLPVNRLTDGTLHDW